MARVTRDSKTGLYYHAWDEQREQKWADPVDEDGLVNVDRTVSVGGLGGDDQRHGTFEYYMSEPIRLNDDKGVGPFIMAGLEIERAGPR